MVNITRVYTRTGDAGTTRLSNNEVAPKTDPRVQAYGQVDETNCTIGVALTLDPSDDMQKVLAIVQNELFDVGATCRVPWCPIPSSGRYAWTRPRWIAWRSGSTSSVRTCRHCAHSSCPGEVRWPHSSTWPDQPAAAPSGPPGRPSRPSAARTEAPSPRVG
ncbi:Cobalamin adenosyltransferase [Propionibacterium freudenreichii]|nr:Cobalamin adenosyltransferase [Propionibacterium freudenreichii]